MTTYKCLVCGHQFEPKKEDANLAKPRQCGKCWSYAVISLEEYELSKAKVLEWLDTRPLRIIPVWDVIRGVFAARGLRLSPVKTVMLCDAIYRELREKGVI